MVGMAVAAAAPAIVTLSTAVARFAKAVAMVSFLEVLTQIWRFS